MNIHTAVVMSATDPGVLSIRFRQVRECLWPKRCALEDGLAGSVRL